MVKQSPDVEVEPEPDEKQHLRVLLIKELRARKPYEEEARKEMEKILEENPLIQDVYKYFEWGWIWWTIIPEKSK